MSFFEKGLGVVCLDRGGMKLVCCGLMMKGVEKKVGCCKTC